MDREPLAREEEPERSRPEPKAAPVPQQLALASAIGNQAYGAMIARAKPGAGASEPATWRAPLDYGTASTRAGAASLCLLIALEAAQLMDKASRTSSTRSRTRARPTPCAGATRTTRC